MKYFILFLLALPALAQEDVQIQTVKVTDNIHMLIGDGGNLGLCSGEDGVFMIDDQFAPMSEKIKAAVAKITDQRVKFLVNTHYHFDHTGGNENFGKADSIIVAHENVRTRLSAGQFMADFNMKVPPAPKAALPVVTFTQDMTFHMNGDEIHVVHIANAHTDGDSVIWFKKSNVVHMGDCFFNGFFPYFDIHSGGSLAGMIKATEQVLKQVDELTKIIPGHGPLAKKADLQAFHDMLADVFAQTTKLIAQGKTLEEVNAASPTAKYDAIWGDGFLKPEQWMGLVYNDLVRNKK